MRKLTLPLLLLAPALAHGATLTVTSTGDDASDPATLRGAIAAAADGDTIAFDASLAGATIALDKTLGPLEYSGSLTIDGGAGAPVTIDGGAGAVDQGIAYAGSSRTTYLIHATGTSATTTLRNLVFTGSKANQSKNTPDVGPAVSILGSAVIDNCYWTNNGVARSGNFNSVDGGGCLRVGGDLTLTNSKFKKNGTSAGSGTYSLGGDVLAKGATVIVRNCDFSETYGWDGNSNGSATDFGALCVVSATTSLLVENTVFEKNVAQHAGGAIYVAGASGGSFVFRNCRFAENKNVQHGIKHGGAVTFGGPGQYLFENCEFADNRCGGYGGAVRSQDGNANIVFANCTFVNDYGNDWGGAVDSRGPAWYVNCTAGGNVNKSSNNNGSGTFFTESKSMTILNCALVWNWSNDGTVKNDTSRYGGSLNIYNSYNYSAGTGPSVHDGLITSYDENTAFFAEPYASLSSLSCFGSTYSFAQAIRSPVLSSAPDAATPRVVEIDRNGVLLSTGWPVKHDADWQNIAYSKDGGSTWTALRGSAASATTLLAADSRGAAYAVADGLPVTPIGSATVPICTVAWDVATNGGEWGDGTTAAATEGVYRGDPPVVPTDPLKTGWNFVGWNTDPAATTALNLAAATISANTTYYAIFEEISATDAVVDWFDDDGSTPLVPASTIVPDGTRPTHAEPEKEATAQYSYTFAGWTLVGGDGTVYETTDLPVVTGGTTLGYKAVYTPALRSYTVVFKNEDGTVISSATYAYGTTAAQINVPSPGTVTTYEWTYAFTGWDEPVVDVAGDATYTAVYSRTANAIPLATADYRRSLEMTATGYDGAGTLANFPVLVRLSSAISGYDGSTVEDPSEIRFADAAGNLVPHEIDTWDPTGESTVWVSLPVLSGTDTSFTMYWTPVEGATQQTALTASRVWTEAGYLGVWHFSPAQTARIYANSAQAEHYATASATATEMTGGIVGGFIQFPNGASTLVNGCMDWVDYTPHMTLEFWVDRQNKGDARVFGSGNSYDMGASIYMSGYISGNGGHSDQRSSLVPETGWRHVSMNFSASSAATALADGTESFTYDYHRGGTPADGNTAHFFHNVNDGSSYADFHAFSLTSNGSGADAFKGYADEFRVRGENSTPEWMQANYDTQAPGTDFLAYGTVQFRGAVSFSGLSVSPRWTTLTALGTFSVPDGSSGTATFTLYDANGTPLATQTAATAVTPENPAPSVTFANLVPGTAYQVAVSADFDGASIGSTENATATTAALPAATLSNEAGAATLSAAFSVETSDYAVRAVFTPVDAGNPAATIAATDDGVSAVSATATTLARDADYVAVLQILSGQTVIAQTAPVSFLSAGFPLIDESKFYQSWTFTVTNHYAENGTTELAPAAYLPVPLHLSSGNPEGFAPKRYGGGALLRAEQDGQALPVDVETWDPDGESIVWVNVPVVTNGAAFSLLAPPKNVSAAGLAAIPGQRPERVWRKAGYVGVWHMGGADAAADSAGYAGTAATADLDTPAVNETVPGPLGRSLVSRSTTRLDFPAETTSAWDLSGGFVLEAWLTPCSYDYARILSASNTYERFNTITVGQSQYYHGNGRHHGPSRSWVGAAREGGWDHVQFVYEGSAVGSRYDTYDDGVWLGNGSTEVSEISYADGIGLVSWRGGGAGLDGNVDEIRVRLAPSSAAWARANYLAMKPDVPYLGVELARDFLPATMVLIK